MVIAYNRILCLLSVCLLFWLSHAFNILRSVPSGSHLQFLLDPYFPMKSSLNSFNMNLHKVVSKSVNREEGTCERCPDEEPD